MRDRVDYSYGDFFVVCGFDGAVRDRMRWNMADKTEIRTSVRNLVEFILRSGNIDNRRASSPENAMLEGGRIHRMIQKRMGADYRAEVALKYRYETGQYTVIVEGRADGIIKDTGEDTKQGYAAAIDEIKGTYHDLKKLKKPASVHLAQAKCYAYMYAKQEGLDGIRVRMTYCNIDTEEIK